MQPNDLRFSCGACRSRRGPAPKIARGGGGAYAPGSSKRLLDGSVPGAGLGLAHRYAPSHDPTPTVQSQQVIDRALDVVDHDHRHLTVGRKANRRDSEAGRCAGKSGLDFLSEVVWPQWYSARTRLFVTNVVGTRDGIDGTVLFARRRDSKSP